MQLLSFSVTNYRSITSAQGVTLARKTVLIGRNNEGKSNVLRALQTSMQLLQRHALAELRPSRVISGGDDTYLWSRDFPLKLQKRPSNRGPSSFRVEPNSQNHGHRRARWACGQAAFEPVHMSTGRLPGAWN